MAVYGVDIHTRYQAGIDFAKLRREGYGFAVMKFTEGSSVSYLASAKRWIPQIRAAGLLAGGYHWIGHGSSGASQARYFWDHVKQLGGPKGMLIQLDCEDNATQTDVTEWVNEWNRLSGRHPFLLYSSDWWWERRGWNGTKWTPYLWDSEYLSADANTVSDDVAAFAARVPASWWRPGYGGWPQATILQFTSKGDAGTLGNKVDLNIYRGDIAGLRKLAGITEEADMALRDDPDFQWLMYRMEALYCMLPATRRGPGAGETNQVAATIKAVVAAVGQVDEQVGARLAGTLAAIQAAAEVTPDEADVFADALYAKLGGTPVADIITLLRGLLPPDKLAELKSGL